MQTKVPWYLNPFYPAFATGLGLVFAAGLAATARAPKPGRRLAVQAAVVIVALGVAEGRLAWYSYRYRDLSLSDQSLLLIERRHLHRRRLYQDRGTRAGHFVAEAVVGAESHPLEDGRAFMQVSRPGDYLLTAEPCSTRGLVMVRAGRRHFLCRHDGEGDPRRPE
jgi:hypothetical protein